MRLIDYIAFSVALMIISCNNSETKSSDQSAINGPGKTCFSKFAKDTIELSFASTGDSISGTLAYKIFEKDKTEGVIHGHFKGDTLFAEYTFQSEGMQSLREIVFLKKGDVLVQGIGPIEEKGNRQYFTDYKQIHFDSGIELKKSNCPN